MCHNARCRALTENKLWRRSVAARAGRGRAHPRLPLWVRRCRLEHEPGLRNGAPHGCRVNHGVGVALTMMPPVREGACLVALRRAVRQPVLREATHVAGDIDGHQATKEIILIQFLKIGSVRVEQSGNSVVLRFSVLFRHVLICYILTKQVKSAGESVVAVVEEAVFASEWRSVPSMIGSPHRRSVVARVVARAVGHLSTEHREATANRDATSNVQA